jgi:hypothetical protein
MELSQKAIRSPKSRWRIYRVFGVVKRIFCEGASFFKDKEPFGIAEGEAPSASGTGG